MGNVSEMSEARKWAFQTLCGWINESDDKARLGDIVLAAEALAHWVVTGELSEVIDVARAETAE